MTTTVMADRQSLLNSYATLFGSAAVIALLSGTMPTNADTAFSGNAIAAACPMSSTPFAAATAATPSVLAANAITSENAYTGATVTFYRAYAQGTAGILATALVAGTVYQIQAMGTTSQANWTAAGCAGTPAVGSVFVATGATTGSGTAYQMNTVEQGVVGQSASGGTSSFSGSSMTIVTPATAGAYAVGSVQVVTATGVPANTTIVSLTSGTANTPGAVYLLSNAVTTEGTEAVSATWGDLAMLNPTLTAGQPVTISSYQKTM